MFQFCFIFVSANLLKTLLTVLYLVKIEMKTTKLLIALTAVVALIVLATGIVLAQNTTPYYRYSTNPYPQDQGFWGWLGGCFRGSNQQYYPYQQTPSTQPNTDSNLNQQPQNPGYYYAPQSPSQGYYSGSYGRGCWGW